jgi:hypothetical protein
MPTDLGIVACCPAGADISLILHRFKDVRTSILTLIFENSRHSTTTEHRCSGSHELSDLPEKLGKTPEEAAEILGKVIPPPMDASLSRPPDPVTWAIRYHHQTDKSSLCAFNPSPST